MIVATVQPSAPAEVRTPKPGSRSTLGLRLASAAILGPAVVGIVLLGSPYMELLVLLAAGLLAWEWAGLCGAARPLAAPALSAPALVLPPVLLAVAAAALGRYEAGLWLIVAGAPLAGAGARALGHRDAGWLALGVPYVALPCLTLLWLRLAQPEGAILVIWLLLVIWATDSGAYFAGRAIGGPKLAPRISPNKTWAGLFGGMAAAGLVGAGGLYLLPGHPLAPLVLFGALLAALSQGGDLFESHVKRRFGAKDSGQLIPGHGGLLDRVDGLMVAILALGALIFFGGLPS